MAYSTIIGCDLCDAVGTQDDPNFHRVEGLIDKLSQARNREVKCGQAKRGLAVDGADKDKAGEVRPS